MGEDNTGERLARLETRLDALEDKLDALNKHFADAKVLERLMQLEFEWKLVKWAGGLLQAALLVLLGVVLKKVM